MMSKKTESLVSEVINIKFKFKFKKSLLYCNQDSEIQQKATNL